MRAEGLPAWGLSWRGYGSATRIARITKRPESFFVLVLVLADVVAHHDQPAAAPTSGGTPFGVRTWESRSLLPGRHIKSGVAEGHIVDGLRCPIVMPGWRKAEQFQLRGSRPHDERVPGRVEGTVSPTLAADPFIPSRSEAAVQRVTRPSRCRQVGGPVQGLTAVGQDGAGRPGGGRFRLIEVSMTCRVAQ